MREAIVYVASTPWGEVNAAFSHLWNKMSAEVDMKLETYCFFLKNPVTNHVTKVDLWLLRAREARGSGGS